MEFEEAISKGGLKPLVRELDKEHFKRTLSKISSETKKEEYKAVESKFGALVHKSGG